MKNIALAILSIMIINIGGCYTKFEKFGKDSTIPEAIIGKWWKVFSTNDENGMPLISDHDFSLEFNADGTHKSNYENISGFYEIKNDTLFVFDKEMSNKTVFIINIVEGDFLRLKTINEKDNFNKFDFYEGNWEWW
jgi:hypothetical protein